jgi:hypothetical protein
MTGHLLQIQVAVIQSPGNFAVWKLPLWARMNFVATQAST